MLNSETRRTRPPEFDAFSAPCGAKIRMALSETFLPEPRQIVVVAYKAVTPQQQPRPILQQNNNYGQVFTQHKPRSTFQRNINLALRIRVTAVRSASCSHSRSQSWISSLVLARKPLSLSEQLPVPRHRKMLIIHASQRSRH